MIRVVAHERRHVEGGREPGLAVLEEVAEALVRLLGRAEAGELAHRPEAAAVHRRVDAARERILARVAEVAAVVDLHVLGRRERLVLDPRDRREELVGALGRLARTSRRARRRATRRPDPRSSPSRRIVGARFCGGSRWRYRGMGGGPRTADVRQVRLRPLLATLVGVLSVVAFVGVATTATAGRTCVSDTRAGGYSYAGHQAASRGHGIRATHHAHAPADRRRGPRRRLGRRRWPGPGRDRRRRLDPGGHRVAARPRDGALRGDHAGGDTSRARARGRATSSSAGLPHRRPRGRRPARLVAGVGRRQARDGEDPHARHVGPLGADRDCRELERRNVRLQRLRLPLRARVGLVGHARLVAAVRLGTPLPRRHAHAPRPDGVGAAGGGVRRDARARRSERRPRRARSCRAEAP